MAGNGKEGGGDAGDSSGRVDWAKISTIAVAVTAVCTAVVAVSGGIPKVITAIFGEQHTESGETARAGNGAAPSTVRIPTSSGNVEISSAGPISVEAPGGGRYTVCPAGYSLVRGDCISPAARSPLPSCQPGWTRDADGVCRAPPIQEMPRIQTCPDGSVIASTDNCPGVQAKTCPDGSTISITQNCPVIRTPIGPFVVFFDWDRDEITATAAGILDNAAAGYRQTGQVSAVVAGHTDRSGSDAYNIGLSQRRANRVAAYLSERGVPGSSITTQPYGESRPLVDTADGVREPQNRRVEITFGPGSGW